jgi:type IV pilus assembly protein PilE
MTVLLSRQPSRAVPARAAEAGITLVELLVAMAIVGILAAIAIPSYQSVTQKSRRHDAEEALMGLRQAMERHYARNGSYAGVANAGVPIIYATRTPTEGSGHYYDLRITGMGPGQELSYELVATPVDTQASDPCGILKLNQAGQRGSARDDGQCWNGKTPYP